MNQISATGNSAGPLGDTASVLTTVHHAWLVALAILVVIGVLYGVHLKRQRTSAERQAIAHAREAGVAPAPAEDTAVAPTPAAAPPTAAVSAPAVAPADRDGDAAGGPLSQLKGLGPKVAGRLAELGVTTIGEMAALSDAQAESIDAQLGAFTGRMGRDRWIEQARFLAAGDRAGFEAVFGKL